MLDAKHLSKFLFIADMAICCDVCCEDTWSGSSENLSDEDIFVNQLWHNDSCPLKGRKDVYDLFSSQKETLVPYSGKLVFEKLNLGNRPAHSIWLHTAGKRYRIVAAHEHFSQIDLTPLDGQPVSVLGTLHGEAIYVCMLITGTGES